MKPVRLLIWPTFLAAIAFGCASYESIFPDGLTGVEGTYLSKEQKSRLAPPFDSAKLANLVVGKTYALRLYNDSLIELRVSARDYGSVTGVSNYKDPTVVNQQTRTTEQGEEVVSSFTFQPTTTIRRQEIKDIMEPRKKFTTFGKERALSGPGPVATLLQVTTFLADSSA